MWTLGNNTSVMTHELWQVFILRQEYSYKVYCKIKYLFKSKRNNPNAHQKVNSEIICAEFFQQRGQLQLNETKWRNHEFFCVNIG